jgi:gamma-glutamyl-gamma-aminobutyrate hydrolase PuuD
MTRNVLFFIVIFSIAMIMNSLSLRKTKSKTKTCASPVIAILANPNLPDAEKITQANINQNYIKWLKESGARVIPLMPWESDDYITSLIEKKINGIIIQGGVRNLHPTDSFEKKVLLIINAVISAYKNENIVPLWAIGQGAQIVQLVLSGAKNTDQILFRGKDVLGNLVKSEIIDSSAEMFEYFDSRSFEAYQKKATTAQFHEFVVDPSIYENPNSKLSQYLKITSLAHDSSGRMFVNSFQGKNGIPIYGTQFHPEKMFNYGPYETSMKGDWDDAYLISKAFANFIKGKAITSQYCAKEDEFAGLKGFDVRGNYPYTKTIEGQEYYYFNIESDPDQPYQSEKKVKQYWNSFI